MALCTSSDAGYDCQKFLTPTARPPETSPAKTSRGAAPGARIQPAALRIGALLNCEAVGVGLHQFETSQTAQSVSSFCPAALNSPCWGCACRRVDPAYRLPRRQTDAAPGHRLHRFRTKVRRPRRRNGRDDCAPARASALQRPAESANEILLFVAVEDDRVDQANRLLPGIEVQPHSERQPFACAFRPPCARLRS